MTENQKKPPPSHILRFRGAHTQLLLATSGRGNVEGHLLGKPPNPRRGTSWKRRQTSSLIHTSLSRGTYLAIAGYLQRRGISDGKGKK